MKVVMEIHCTDDEQCRVIRQLVESSMPAAVGAKVSVGEFTNREGRKHPIVYLKFKATKRPIRPLDVGVTLV